MNLLDKKEIQKQLASRAEDTIFLNPLLEPEKQIGNVTVDLRLGYDFLVSILTREPSIALGISLGRKRRAISTYFQETRRDLGEKFVVYPNQVVLSTTLEYLSLPSNVYADIISRSSFTRLGIHFNTMIQPGFRGCVPLELFNHGNTPVELVVGARICQARFFKVQSSTRYLANSNERAYRKYFGDVRPTVSRADRDDDLPKMQRLVT